MESWTIFEDTDTQINLPIYLITKAVHMRRILKIENQVLKISDTLNLNVKRVWFAVVSSENSRSIKTDHIGVRSYINNKLAFDGVGARFWTKPVSINRKLGLSDPKLVGPNLDKMRRESDYMAFQRYCLSLSDLSGHVVYFDKRSGQGMVRVHKLDMTFPVYACNLNGKRTWHAETACVYLNEGPIEGFSLAEVSTGLTISGLNGLFDAEKWNNLDQSKLAFKVNPETNELESGLFAKGGI
jgi:hypothetical protein